MNVLDSRVGNKRTQEEHAEEGELRNETAGHLHAIVAGMTLDNIIVRPKREYVEKYAVAASWATIITLDTAEIADHLAGLPTQVQDSEEEAKRFDMMILRLQLCVLQGDAGFEKYQKIVKSIAAALELQDSIPAIRSEMPLIQSLNTEDWWLDVTVGMLEQVRKRLRLLIKLLEKTQRPIVYTEFDDVVIGAGTIELNISTTGLDYERFKAKARDFLRTHEDRLAVYKLRTNKPVTSADLLELEKILLEQAAGDTGLVEQAKSTTGGLGLFVRSLVGLERGAAMDAMGEFLNKTNATASQIEFLKLIVNYLTVDGAIETKRLYESPFTNVAATGPDAIFPAATVTQLFKTIEDIRLRAVA